MVYPLKMGVAGAAIATGAANLLAMLVGLSHFIFKKGRLRICGFRPSFRLYRKIMLRGLPEMISQFANPVTAFSMNNILINHLGNTAVNAYSVITYASSLFSSLMWGVSSGLQPLFTGLATAQRATRILKYYFRNGKLIALVGGTAVFLLTFAVGKPLCKMFGADGETLPIVCASLPKYCLNYVFAALTAVIAAYLFSTKRTKYAISINVCPQHRSEFRLHQLPSADLRIRLCLVHRSRCGEEALSDHRLRTQAAVGRAAA